MVRGALGASGLGLEVGLRTATEGDEGTRREAPTGDLLVGSHRWRHHTVGGHAPGPGHDGRDNNQALLPGWETSGWVEYEPGICR
jgi:hypothetical protein